MSNIKRGDTVKIAPMICDILGGKSGNRYTVIESDEHGCYLYVNGRKQSVCYEWLTKCEPLTTEPSNEPTGGLSNHYLVTVDKPQRGGPAYQAECDDIIYALRMTFDEGEAFKAIWRTCTARLGYGKKDNTALYNAQKLVHRSNRILQRAEEQGE